MNEEIFRLLVKKISNELDEKDKQHINNLIKTNQEIAQEYETLCQVWEETGHSFENEDLSTAYKNVSTKIISLKKQNRKRFIKKNFQYAAAILFIFTTLTFALIHKKTIKIVNTDKAVKTVTLPDNSVVTLSENAEIWYKSSILQKFDREINFKGEGFFEIAKDPNKKFVVHLQNFDVTVYGTKFNIATLDKKETVVLVEGKVTVDNFTSDKSKQISLIPDQMVEYNTINGEITIKNVNPQIYTFWKNDKFEFNNFSINEIIDIFKIYYGKTVVFDDTTLKNKQIGGSAPTDDLSLIIDALAYITDTKPFFNKDTIYFK